MARYRIVSNGIRFAPQVYRETGRLWWKRWKWMPLLNGEGLLCGPWPATYKTREGAEEKIQMEEEYRKAREQGYQEVPGSCREY